LSNSCGRTYFPAADVRQQAPAGQQSAPIKQQSDLPAFALLDEAQQSAPDAQQARPRLQQAPSSQHGDPGKQQSDPGTQQSSVLQHASCNSQHSDPGKQHDLARAFAPAQMLPAPISMATAARATIILFDMENPPETLSKDRMNKRNDSGKAAFALL
jgi:hypothetical protein